MLPAAHRLRSSSEFTAVLRQGRRAGRPTLTLHLLEGVHDDAPRAGLVVSKAVGGSVVRHAVSRRLRHVLQVPVTTLPRGTRLVVRAAPAAATASSSHLAADLEAALARLVRR